MKRVLVAVVFGSSITAPSQATSSGWGAASSTTRASGAWPSVPSSVQPNTKHQDEENVLPFDETNAPVMGYSADSHNNVYNDQTGESRPGEHEAAVYEGQGVDAAVPGGGSVFGEVPSYNRHQQHQQQQQEHQYRPYEPPYAPQQSRWAGQYNAPPQQQQQQQQQQLYGRGQFPQYQGPNSPVDGGGGDAMRLGTKWKSIVSRVKDAVRPGQTLDYGQAGRHQGEEYGGGGSSSWTHGAGGGEGGYAPPSSSWVGGAGHNAGGAPPPGAYEQASPEASASYGYDQPRAPQAEGYNSNEVPGRYSSEENGAHAFNSQSQLQEAPPPAFFDSQGSIDSPAQQSGAKQGETGSWQSSAHQTAVVQQPPKLYNSSNGGNDVSHEEYSGGIGEGADGHPWHSTHDNGMPSVNAFSNESPSHVLGQDSPYAPPQGTVGQGWAASGADPSHDPPPRQEPRQEDDQGGLESELPTSSSPLSQGSRAVGQEHSARRTGETATSPVAVPAVMSDAQGYAARDQGGEQIPPLGTSSSPSPDSSYRTTAGTPLDIMPSSADHGMEKVDWGKGAEEENDERRDGEDQSGETVVVTDAEKTLEQEREEEALVRELERMEGIGGDELLNSSGETKSECLSPALKMEEWEEREEGNKEDERGEGVNEVLENQQAIIDEEVEHRLDDLFDSILDDDFDDMTDDAECTTAASNSSPGPLTAISSAGSPSEVKEDSKFGGGQPKYLEVQPESRLAASSENTSSSVEANARLCEEGSAHGDGAAEELNSGSADADKGGSVIWEEPATLSINPEGKTMGSVWGKTRRWASLPPTTMVVSKPVEEEDEESEVEVDVPLEPIELPPSAATDEIWNDQHLQEQLDAYWEQSRRGGALDTGGGGSGPTSPTGGRHFSTHGGLLQPKYGPGDWAGRGTAMVQDPLPGAGDDIVQSSWVEPRLVPQGGQAPINIYGNVHVHLKQGCQEGDSRPPQQSPELSARERYYSQGETSWSGSERGGH